MCDYSLEHVKSRPAKISDKLTTCDFGRVTRGFAASEDRNVAVCVLPGTELSFASEVKCVRSAFVWSERVISHKTAITENRLAETRSNGRKPAAEGEFST